MTLQPNLEPQQIVCLEHQGSCLYAEVVQIARARQLCWARPLVLLEALPSQSATVSLLEAEHFRLHDLRQGADLLWPMHFFRPALDTEVIPLITQLYSAEPTPVTLNPSYSLRAFIEQVWQAHLNKPQT